MEKQRRIFENYYIKNRRIILRLKKIYLNK